MAKINKNPLAPDAAVEPEFLQRAEQLSINFTPTAPSSWFQRFGFDELRATTGQIASAAKDKGWQETGIDSLARMKEIKRAQELTEYSEPELRSLYGRRHRGARGGASTGWKYAPTLEEFGLTERPTMMQPDEANTKYGISGHLSWDKPVSSLVAKIQHERKLEEVRLNSTLNRAQGFADNAIGFGVSMGAAIFDPVGLALGFVPLVGQGRYANMTISAGRFLRGAEAGFVGSLGVEPLIYAAKTQEKADYDMYDSLLNVTFGTVAGGGLFAVGGKMYDGYKGIQAKSHQKALEQAVKQLSLGKNVEVEQIATIGSSPMKPIAADINGSVPTNPDSTIQFKDDPSPYNAVKQYSPNQSVETSLTLMEQSTTGPAAEIPKAKLEQVLKDPELVEAIKATADNNLTNNVAFYVKTADGNVLAVNKGDNGPMSLLTSPSFTAAIAEWFKPGTAKKQAAAAVKKNADVVEQNILANKFKDQNAHPANPSTNIKNPSIPTIASTWTDYRKTATWAPNSDVPAELNGVPMSEWTDAPTTIEGWKNVDGQNPDIDRQNPFTPHGTLPTSAGAVVIEPDGRVWVIDPTNKFADVDTTFPKGKVEDGLTMQQTAIKEVFEETGLKIKIIGLVGDYDRTTSRSRMYVAQRVGGRPDKMGAESQAVKLATPLQVSNMLNQGADFAIANDMLPVVDKYTDSAFQIRPQSMETPVASEVPSTAMGAAENFKDLLAIHGLTATEDFNVSYKGSYNLASQSMTHVIEVNGAVFNPEQNQHYVTLAPEDTMKSVFSQDPASKVFDAVSAKGAASVQSAMFDPQKYLTLEGEKYTSFAGYDTTVDASTLKQLGPQLGTNKGGTFEGPDGDLFYVKYQDADHSLNEWVATTLYQWYDVLIPKMTIVTDGRNPTAVGTASQILPLKTITPKEFKDLPDNIKRDFARHVLIDAFLGNYDVVGNAPNYNLHISEGNNSSVFRLDAGGALVFRAQGKKKDDFTANFKYNTFQAANPEVFSNYPGVSQDLEDAALAILRVPHEQIIKLVDAAKQHGMSDEVAEQIKKVLFYRRIQLEQTYPEMATKAGEEKNIKTFQSFSDAKQAILPYQKELRDKLTDAQIKVIQSYTGSYHDTINTALWDQAHGYKNKSKKGQPLDSKIQKDVDLLDNAFSKISPLSVNLEVYRGGVFFTTFNSALESVGGKQFIFGQAMKAEEVFNMLKPTQGKYIQMESYVSSSFSMQTAKSFNKPGSLLVKILIPEGNKAILAGDIGLHQGESEAILPRKSIYRIKEVVGPDPMVQSYGTMVVLEMVPPGASMPEEVPDVQKLKIAKAYHQQLSNSADLEPMPNEPIDAVGDSLKGIADDLGKIDGELESLQMSIEAESVNLDPELAAGLKAALDADIKQLDQLQADAQIMHKAAQAAVVCVRKGI